MNLGRSSAGPEVSGADADQGLSHGYLYTWLCGLDLSGLVGEPLPRQDPEQGLSPSLRSTPQRDRGQHQLLRRPARLDLGEMEEGDRRPLQSPKSSTLSGLHASIAPADHLAEKQEAIWERRDRQLAVGRDRRAWDRQAERARRATDSVRRATLDRCSPLPYFQPKSPVHAESLHLNTSTLTSKGLRHDVD